MDNTQSLLTRLKSLKNIETYYQLSKFLGRAKNTGKRYWEGRGTLDDESAIKVARALNLSPHYVLACMSYERCPDPEARQVWSEIAAHYSNIHSVNFSNRSRG